MPETRTIEIDFDVHKRIELARKSFDESDTEVLRRLLDIQSRSNEKNGEKHVVASEGRAWSGKGVILPHGTELRMEYRGRVHEGVIEEGVWVVDGERAHSPSDAAGSVAMTKDGARPSLNGWIYWQVKRPTDRGWKALSSLRRS